MPKFSSYIADLSDPEYRNFVEERMDIIGASIERLARLFDSELARLPDCARTEDFKARLVVRDELRQLQGLMQSRFTGD